MSDALVPPVESALLPCPFCGGSAGALSEDGNRFSMCIYCNGCDACGPVYATKHETKSIPPGECAPDLVTGARNLWNRRAAITLDENDERQVEVAAEALRPEWFGFGLAADMLNFGWFPDTIEENQTKAKQAARAVIRAIKEMKR